MRLCFFQVTEYTLEMKCVTHLALIAFISGVYSVSFSNSAHAYTVSRSTFSASDSDSIRMTRSARETVRGDAANSNRVYSQTSAPLSPGTHNLSVSVGQIFLVGDLSNEFENALGTQVHYTYGVSDLFSFESDFGYSSHSNGNFSLVNLDAALRTNLIYFDQLVPFASLGLGFYNPSKTFNDNSKVSALLFGLQLGGGVDLLLNKSFFFGTRLNYHNMFDSSKVSSNGIARPIGGSFVSFMIHAGVTF
jgi:hypothetical protein